jgi:Domain of unknown function (DUF1911)/Domain of unknown function (DUF1910)
MRETLSTKIRLDTFILDCEKSNNEWQIKLEKGETNPNKIFNLKRNLSWVYFTCVKAKYSRGDTLSEITTNFYRSIELCYESWIGDSWKLKFSETKKYDQYILSGYDQMIWMLSLGYLLDIPDEYFNKLVAVIDRDKVKDYLFEFIIRARIKDRPIITEESYRDYFGVPKVFEKLRQAITETDKPTAEKLVKEFVRKDWYNRHKGQGWIGSHNSPHNTYFGYWSFETAAIVKIMGLDDTTFIDCKYYPKDLVHGEKND